MSWPLASFLIVALVLVAGWLAYERRRPSARTAAVVAVLAALAALGRDAFAALPDVKPITAITFVTGYALGPLPGFTVGALGMLVSNFMLGQGPYTPWQMAAWGMVGLAGAVVGRLARGRLGRVQLALACGVSALAAKEVMNVYTWTLGASHTPAAFMLVAGQALAYDITDMVASFLFGLAFAPELARVLTRTRVRMQVVWEPLGADDDRGTARGRLASGRTAGLACVLAALAAALSLQAGVPRSARAAPQARPEVARQVSFLAGAQNADGGFGGARGQTSTELYSAWAAIGLAAAGRDPLSLHRGGHTVLDAIRAEAGSLHGAGDLERTILALRACGASARSLPGRDPVAKLLHMQSSDGSFGHLANLTAFGVLALRAAGYGAGDSSVAAAARWLRRQQNRDGGFGFQARGGPSDIDDTGAALQALAAAGQRTGSSARAGVAFLRRNQNRDGGFPQQPEGSSNAQSTAWAVQGLAAAGVDAAALTRAGSRSPVGYLQSLVAPDGSVRYSRTGSQTPVWVTAQALTGLAQRPLPIAPVAHARRSGVPSHTRDSHALVASALGVLEGTVRAMSGLVAALVGAAALA